MKNVIQLSNPSIDVLSVILSTLGFGSLLYGFSSVGDKGWGSPQVYGFLIVGAIVLCLFTYRQLHLEQPFLELRVLNQSLYCCGHFIWRNQHGNDWRRNGFTFVYPKYSWRICLPFRVNAFTRSVSHGTYDASNWSHFDKIGARRLAITGMFILTAATLPFAFLTKATPIIYIIVLYAIRMFGISMVMMPVTTSGMNALPMNLLSHGTAVNNTFRQVASSIGTAVLISVLTNVTKDGLPASDLLKTAPLTYRDQATNATLNGYHAASSWQQSLAFSALAITSS